VNKPKPARLSLTASDDWIGRHRELAELALRTGRQRQPDSIGISRHLAFLAPTALELDLTDPAQREFGDYELLDKLGQGGMGVVYRARQRSLDREVAIKLLAAGPWAAAHFIERFRREAQAAARMQHPNIVPIHEIGTQEELNYYAMGLVRGQSLADRLRCEGPFDPREAALLLRSIAEAVDYAHRLDVLHLDLKPANILLDEHGVPHIADFGLARRLSESVGGGNDEICGTPSYMAPEQARGQTLGPATDIYGLGAILYELLTGQPPFVAASPEQILQRVLDEPAMAPTRAGHRLSADLQAVTLKCLAKDPQHRYSSARALADDLSRYLDGRAVSVRQPGPAEKLARASRREPRLTAALAALGISVLVGLLLITLAWRQAQSSADQARQSLWDWRNRVARAEAASGDGYAALHQLAANLDEIEQAGRSDLAAVERRRIGVLLAKVPRLRAQVGTAGVVSALAYAPDHSRIAVADVAPSAPRMPETRPRGVSLYDANDLSLLWRVDTTDRTTRRWFVSTFLAHSHLNFSPDGSRLRVLNGQNGFLVAPRQSDALLLDVASGRLLEPPVDRSLLADTVYSADGRWALLRWREADEASMSATRFEVWQVAPWQQRSERRRIDHAWGTEWLWAPDGRWLLGLGAFSQVALYDPLTLQAYWRQEVGSQAGPLSAWAVSADSRWLALGHSSGRILLIEPGSPRLRQIGGALGGRINALSLDNDGSNLYASSEAGELRAWSLIDAEPVMRTEVGLQRQNHASLLIDGPQILALSQAHALLRWQLSEPGSWQRSAVLETGFVRTDAALQAGAFDLNRAKGHLLTGGRDRLLQWQLPAPVIRRSPAPTLPEQPLRFDGKRLIRLEGSSLQVVSVVDESPLSPRWHFDEPLQAAAFSADGSRLLAVAAGSLRLWDSSSWEPVGTPIALGSTPIRLLLAEQAKRALLTTLEQDEGGTIERLHLIDLELGRRIPVQGGEDKPLSHLLFDPSGRYAVSLYVGPNRYPRWHALDGTGPDCGSAMQTLGTILVQSMAASGGGRFLWIYHSQSEDSSRTRLQRLDTLDCSFADEPAAPFDYLSPIIAGELLASGETLLINRFPPDRLLHRSGGGWRGLAGLPVADAVSAAALSPDERLVALATRNAVQVIDLPAGVELTGRMKVAIAAEDAIAQLAFAPDGRSLLGRTILQRWLVWPLPSDDRPSGQILAEAAALDPIGLHTADTVARAAGPAPLAPTPASVSTGSSDAVTGNWPDLALAGITEAAEGGAERLLPLDLGPIANVGLNAEFQDNFDYPGSFPTLPRGRQRLAGIDWLIGDSLQLASSPPPLSAIIPLPKQSESLALPEHRLRAVHLLAFQHWPAGRFGHDTPTAVVLLIDRAGRQTELPLYIPGTTEVISSEGDLLERSGSRASVAWLGTTARSVRIGRNVHEAGYPMVAVRVLVPDHVGPVSALRLSSADVLGASPRILALTLELAHAD
jgi:WD40 repeat protein